MKYSTTILHRVQVFDVKQLMTKIFVVIYMQSL